MFWPFIWLYIDKLLVRESIYILVAFIVAIMVDYAYCQVRDCKKKALFRLTLMGDEIWAECKDHFMLAMTGEKEESQRHVYKDIMQDKHREKYRKKIKGKICLMTEDKILDILKDLFQDDS